MKKNSTTVILILFLVAGLSLLLYPTVSDYWNSFHQSKAIASYAQSVANLDSDTYERMKQEAESYNLSLSQKAFNLKLTEEETLQYNSVLDITGTGIMAYVEIPKVNCTLPIYHGTGDAVLQIAAGHIEGTSLPVGGEGTHCVISGHRGLPSARLFSDIDQLVAGDRFMVRTLDEVLTYEVDQILIVLPYEVSALEPEPGKDLCTLVTCTPYGINTHRLLVRGHRVETINQKEIRVTADAAQIDPLVVAPIIAIPLLMMLLLTLLISEKRKYR